jgi:peptidoglycan-N-acetylglucosamine deacetylase
MNKFICGLFFVLFSTSTFAECAKQKTIYINAKDYPTVGIEQYKQTIPLNDHEIILTFDDGPSINTKLILNTLDNYCLKATFFVVGQMVQSSPTILEDIILRGHNVGNHSYSHPMPFEKLKFEKQIYQIEEGQNNIKAVIGDKISPVFRFPGLGRSTQTENYLNSKNISVWSVDVETKDYMYSHKDSFVAKQYIINNAMTNLSRNHRGIILMHDIHKNTADALPYLIETLKNKGYTFVQVKFK